MKKLIAVLMSLCLVSGYPTDCISEVIEVFADPQYSLAAKETAIEVVTAQLEDLYNSLVNEENPYSQYHNCNPY